MNCPYCGRPYLVVSSDVRKPRVEVTHRDGCQIPDAEDQENRFASLARQTVADEVECWCCLEMASPWESELCFECYTWAEREMPKDATEEQIKAAWLRHQEQLDFARENGHGFHTPRGDWPDRSRHQDW